MLKKSKRSGHGSGVDAFAVDLRYDRRGDGHATEDTALYIADMIGALAEMASGARLDLLSYLLNMARVEAELQARQTETADEA